MSSDSHLIGARTLLAIAPQLLPSRLLSADELCTKAQDFNLGWFSSDDIERLWRFGLLRADICTGTGSHANARFQTTKAIDDDGHTVLVDCGRASHRTGGYGEPIESSLMSFHPMELRFHPFRIYVLHHVSRIFTVTTTATQYLGNAPGVTRVVERVMAGLNHWTSTIQFGERFDYWNRVAELAIACEPVLYNEHARLGALLPGRWEQYRETVHSLLVDTNLHSINEQREELAFAAECLDANRTVHTLLRLMKGSEQLRLKGRLGAAMHMLNMAEVIRRAHEHLLGSQLPEEDEIGPGQWMDGARKMLYGHDRVFDAPRRNLREFLTILGLDFGTKVRCYVEGATELGALTRATGLEGQVELVNLRGNFVERGGKGLTFVESLENDFNSHVFSLVVLDGDRADVVRIVQRAAEDEKFFGRFWVCEPDFEYANFTSSELIEVVLEMVKQHEVTATDRSHLRDKLQQMSSKAKSGKSFLASVREAGIEHVGKGEAWGQALMTYAIKYPNFPSNHISTGQERPIIDIAKLIIRAQSSGFLSSMRHSKLDSKTGKLISKN